ncbi:ABC transporter substrate-binding protein [Rhodopseudomonas sp. HC1]|uniref:ABC transporter substrate-binding protein n=1 Tax=Rhodopseudomonas infernalis TaxID=2897386 RepID=UPI001EE99683|nr:ABC transporter substrate-binding protein [Rhodopseudomonas infernalis]MCG6205531.1 ABC transporter substrate-binding protein [Rhodopseudomonas infernalis]
MNVTSNRRRVLKSAVFAACSLALLAIAGPVQAAEPGVAEKSIKIGVLGSLTGPLAVFGTGNLAGATMAFEEANAAGGINGRKIEWVSLDDESSPPKGIAAYKKLIDQEQVFAVFGPAASAVGQALVPTFKQSKTPTFISVFSTPAVTEPPIPVVFRTGPMNDRQQGTAIANYVVDHLKAKKIALIRQSDEYGKRGGESVSARLTERKIGLVADENFNIADTDFTAQLSRINQAAPDVLIVYGYPNPSAIITRQAKQLGLKATVMGANSAGSRKYPEIVGEAAAGTQNIVTLKVLPEGDDPAAVKFRAAFEKRFPDLARQGRPDLGDVLGYGGAQVFIEGLKRTEAAPTQAGFIKALESLKGFETELTLPTTFSPTEREGNQAAKIVEIQSDLSRKLLPLVVRAEGETAK